VGRNAYNALKRGFFAKQIVLSSKARRTRRNSLIKTIQQKGPPSRSPPRSLPLACRPGLRNGLTEVRQTQLPGRFQSAFAKTLEPFRLRLQPIIKRKAIFFPTLLVEPVRTAAC
jgi:hypothetical protein